MPSKGWGDPGSAIAIFLIILLTWGVVLTAVILVMVNQ